MIKKWFNRKNVNRIRNLAKSNRGFTMVELIIVIVIIGILATVMVPTIGNMQNSAREKGVETDFGSFKTTFNMMLQEQSGLPTAVNTDAEYVALFAKYADKVAMGLTDLAAAAGTGYATLGFNAYDAAVAAAANDGVFVSAKLDPWGKPYIMRILRGSGTKFVAYVISYGPDGLPANSATPADADDNYALITTYDSGYIRNATVGMKNNTGTLAAGDSADMRTEDGGYNFLTGTLTELNVTVTP